MAKLDDLFRFMKAQGASDLHLSSGSSPYIRLHGNMVPMNYRALTAEECQALIFEILSEKQKQSFVNNLELDLAYTLEGTGRFRCNIFLQRKGMGAVFRIIPQEIKSLDQLHMPPVLKDLCKEHKGLIVVTGPTGSGKSTTLAAMIEYINQTESTHILTVEDPIEFVYENKKSLINQREVSSHTKSFSNALKAALREDPDIILVGEMRDLETISLAMTAAETGHLVFGTLHTNNAHKTVDRIIDVFPEAQQAQIRVMLSESLKAVVAQSLLTNATGNGRVAVNEILINSVAVSNLIREGKTFQIPSTMQTSKGSGMMTFETHVNQLISEGRLGKDEGMAFLGKSISASVNAATNPQAQQPQRATPPPIHTTTNSNISPIPGQSTGGIPMPPPMKKKA
jgi:twitching motility protein PilT